MDAPMQNQAEQINCAYRVPMENTKVAEIYKHN